MDKPRLYLFVGYPGAGKTTVARIIQAKTGAVHLWADQARQMMFENADFTAEESAALYESLNERTERLLAAGQSVIFDTNFNYHKDRARLRDIASRHQAETTVIWLQTPLELARERATEQSDGNETRVWGNMPAADFDRISRHLEPPSADEHFVTIDGTKVSELTVSDALGL